MGKLKVEKVVNGILSENCYFVHDEDSKNGFCIDPGIGTTRIMDFLKSHGYKVDAVLLTHGHFDHMLSVDDIVNAYDSKVYCTKIEEDIIYSVENSYAIQARKNEPPKFSIYKNVNDNEIVNICGCDVKCITTPGHTIGGVCYYIENEKALFSGDTLFYETYGRTDLYSGNIYDMQNSIINKLFVLPDDVKVYPGHGEDTMIGFEKKNNPITGGF